MKKSLNLLLILIISFTVKGQLTIDSTHVVKTCLDCDSIGVSLFPYGSLYIEVSGGTSPYFFNLTGEHIANLTPVLDTSNGAMTFNQLCQDTFKLKVTDNNGDSVIYNFTTIPPLPPTFTIDSVSVEADNTDNPDSGVIELFVTTNADSVFYKIKEQTNSIQLGTLGGWQDSTLFDSLPGGFYYNVYIDIYPKVMTCGSGTAQIDSSTSVYSIYVPLACENGFAYPNSNIDACVGEMIVVDGFGDPGSGVDNFILFDYFDFGDGGFEPGPGPVFYAYSQPGDYWITYFMESTHGCMFQGSTPITIHPLPETNFNIVDNGGGNYLFTDMSTGATITDWYWDFGDGSNSTDQNPIHQYASTGMYTVCLTTTSNYNCDSTYCSDVNYSLGVGINELTTFKTNFYPNPVNDVMTIELNKPQSGQMLIVDVIGNEVKVETFNLTQKFTTDLTELPEGIYFLKINNEVIKFIKN